MARSVIQRGDVQIEILSQGTGPLIVLLPSLGRGAEDFDPIAERVAAAGFRVLRPQPRGIGQSQGPMTGIDLHDYANDVAAAIEHAAGGPAFVVGHAFGNRVARLLATVRPDLVRAVSLVAANVGRDPSPPKVRAAIRTSADASLPDDERLAALRFAFFAPGNDASSWLRGWHPDVLAAERIAGDKTPRGGRLRRRPRAGALSAAGPRSPGACRERAGISARAAAIASPSWSFRRRATPRSRSSPGSSPRS